MDLKSFENEIERKLQLPEEYYLKEQRSRKKNQVSFIDQSLPTPSELKLKFNQADHGNVDGSPSYNQTSSSGDSDQYVEDRHLQIDRSGSIMNMMPDRSGSIMNTLPDRSGSIFQMPERVLALPEDYYIQQGTRSRKNAGDTKKTNEMANMLITESIDQSALLPRSSSVLTTDVQSFLQMPENYYLNNQRERNTRRAPGRSESLFEAVQRSGSLFDPSSFQLNAGGKQVSQAKNDLDAMSRSLDPDDNSYFRSKPKLVKKINRKIANFLLNIFRYLIFFKRKKLYFFWLTYLM